MTKFAYLATVAFPLFAHPALAQTAPEPQTPPQATADTSQASPEGDIIVTAQRRDERLSKTPVAVAVVTGDTLAKAQIVSEQDLRTATPGLSIRATLSSEQLNYSLRGQSQDAFSGTRPGVLPYVNDVQIGGNGATAFYDLQSVQVLKGPQGTLFGRSATGGAVLFNTVKPTDKFGGYIDGSYGNYNAYKVEGALNIPLSGDQLMVRVAGFKQERDGFQRNLRDGQRVGKVDRTGLRGSLTIDVPGFGNDLVVDYYRSNGQNTDAVLSGLLPFTGGASPPYIPIQFLYAGLTSPTNPIPNATQVGQGTLFAFSGGPLLGALYGTTPATATPAQLATVTGIINNAYNAYFAPGRGHPADGITAFLASQKAAGPFVVNSDSSNFYKTKNIVITNTSTIPLSGSIRLKNIFGYVNIDSPIAYEADGTPYGISQNGLPGSTTCNCNKITQVSNEIQLLGNGLNDRLEYVVGGYFSRDQTGLFQHSEFFDLVTAPFGLQAQVSLYDFKQTNTTFAGYTQGTYKLNDNGLAFTVGVRYTSEKVRMQKLGRDDFVSASPVAPPGFSYDQSKTYGRLSWQIGLQDQINPNLLIYAVSRRAYKSGGFNGSVQPKIGGADVAGNSYKAEQVTDAELGLKYQGVLASMPTRLNVALFYSWVKDSQRTAFTLVAAAPAALTVNVPRERIYGAEVEAAVRPASWLSVGVTGNYTNAQYTDGNVFAAGIPQTFDQVPDTPKYSGSAFADVTIPVLNRLNFLAHGDVYAQSRSVTTPQSLNSAGTTISGYALANFRLGVEDEEAGWSVTANLKNAFNKVYYVGGLPTGNIYQINTLVPGEPRTYTIAARFKF